MKAAAAATGHVYRCHQCFGLVDVSEMAHVDLYVDLCWIQCEVCACAFGTTCGVNRSANPHPHGYFTCPYRVSAQEMERRSHHARLRVLRPGRNDDGDPG